MYAVCWMSKGEVGRSNPWKDGASRTSHATCGGTVARAWRYYSYPLTCELTRSSSITFNCTLLDMH